eukprot:2409386-Pyramimonas_sp.AAC.1
MQAASEAAEELEYTQFAFGQGMSEGRRARPVHQGPAAKCIGHGLQEPLRYIHGFRKFSIGAQRQAFGHRMHGVQAGHQRVRRRTAMASLSCSGCGWVYQDQL